MPAWRTNCGVGSSGSPTQKARTLLRPMPSLYSSRILDAVSARTAARAESGVSGFMEPAILDCRTNEIRKRPFAGPPFARRGAGDDVRLGRQLRVREARAGRYRGRSPDVRALHGAAAARLRAPPRHLPPPHRPHLAPAPGFAPLHRRRAGRTRRAHRRGDVRHEPLDSVLVVAGADERPPFHAHHPRHPEGRAPAGAPGRGHAGGACRHRRVPERQVHGRVLARRRRRSGAAPRRGALRAVHRAGAAAHETLWTADRPLLHAALFGAADPHRHGAGLPRGAGKRVHGFGLHRPRLGAGGFVFLRLARVELGQRGAGRGARRPVRLPYAPDRRPGGLAHAGRGVHLAQDRRRGRDDGRRGLRTVGRRPAAEGSRTARRGLIFIGKETQQMSAGHGHIDPSNKKIALLIAVLALVLAFSETLGKAAQTNALSLNIEASNLWSFFQAKTVRQTVVRTAAEQTALATENDEAKKQIDAWRKTAQRYQTEPETGEGRDELMARAKEAEKKRDRAMAAYHQYELASAAVQIAIVLASAAIVTTAMVLAWIGAGLGVLGATFCLIGFFAPTSVHIF